MVIQENQSSCGKACVRELMTMLFHDVTFAYMELSSKCQDFYEMRMELKANGVQFESVEVTDLDKINRHRFPFVAQVNREGKSHFVIVRKIRKKTVSVSDPQFGEYDLPKETFLSEFMGKAMLFTSKGKKPKKNPLNLFTHLESFLYLALFLLQSSLLILFLLYSMTDEGFAYSVSFAGGVLITIILQSILNWSVRKRMDEQILLPYMQKSQNPEDLTKINIILTESIRQTSDIISLGSVSVGIITMLFLNDAYLCYLALLALAFACLRYPLIQEKNATARYCSLEESCYLRQLDQKEGKDHFRAARKRANRLLSEIICIWAFEAMIASVLILAQMGIEKQGSVNVFVFYFGLTLGLSVVFGRMFNSLFCQEKKIKAINGLSVSFPSFFIVDTKNIVYNNGTNKKGASEDEETKSHS